MTKNKPIIAANKEIYDFLDSIYTQEHKTLIAISWWADSMYIGLLMQQYRHDKKRQSKNLHYIYCDHNIRKDNNDQSYIMQYITRKQLHIVKREENNNNTEASLRKWRYSEIKKYMQKNQISYLITGHHLSDRIESTFLNLLRWCGIDWFISMQKIQNNSHLIDGKIIRPLLSLSKSYIQHICETNNIQYSNDTTNDDITTSKRNRIRHTIINTLKELSHKNSKKHNSFEESMHEVYTAIERIQQDDDPIYLEQIPMYAHWNIKRSYKRDIDQWSMTTHTIKKLCKQLHIQNNIDKKYIKELTDFLKNKQKWHKYVNHTYFFISHGAIYIIHWPKRFWENTTQNHPENIQELFDQPVKNKNINNRRFNTKTDTIHKKTIKKWCTNQKIPIFWRENIICEIQKNGDIKPIIWDFMKS